MILLGDLEDMGEDKWLSGHVFSAIIGGQNSFDVQEKIIKYVSKASNNELCCYLSYRSIGYRYRPF